MLEVGEKVRYLDDVGEATIIRFIDSKTALVEDEWGLTHPHPVSKLVPANRDHVVATPKIELPKKVIPIVTKTVTSAPTKSHSLPELCLVFESTNKNKPESGDLELWFANGTRHHLLVNVGAKVNDEWFSLYHGEILPRDKQLVQSLRRQDVGTVGNLNVEILFFGKTGYERRQAVSCSPKIKATRFVKGGNYVKFDGIGNPALAIPIENERVIKSVCSIPTAKINSKTTFKSSLPVFEEEVDLHLDAILGTDPHDMPDHEKFLTQMRHFERRLNNALTHKYIEITFIHGVGTGRLKEAIRQELKEYGLPFQDGPFHKYGVGATVVNLNLV